MRHLKFLLYTIIVSFLLAFLEVQIEGSQGWAAQLPTWRLVLPVPVFGMFGYAEKPLTGYHLYLWLLLFALPHFLFLFSKWTIKKELYLIAFYILFTTFEGIFWFLVNPAYGWDWYRFNPNKVNWYHEAWVFGIPVEYWPRFAAGLVFYYIAERFPGKKE